MSLQLNIDVNNKIQNSSKQETRKNKLKEIDPQLLRNKCSSDTLLK